MLGDAFDLHAGGSACDGAGLIRRGIVRQQHFEVVDRLVLQCREQVGEVALGVAGGDEYRDGGTE
jgi:hypothetical protein